METGKMIIGEHSNLAAKLLLNLEESIDEVTKRGCRTQFASMFKFKTEIQGLKLQVMENDRCSNNNDF